MGHPGCVLLVVVFEAFWIMEKVVNRQKLHDWGYVVESKGKILCATARKVVQFTLCCMI
jgi:hypothetical protein